MLSGLESPVHLLLLLLIILLIFGGKRLPEMGRSLGRGIHEFREALTTKESPETTEKKPEKPTGPAEEEKKEAKG